MNKKLGTAILMTAAMTMAGSVSAYADVDTNEIISEPEAQAEVDTAETAEVAEAKEEKVEGGNTEPGIIKEVVETVDKTGKEDNKTVDHPVDSKEALDKLIGSDVVETYTSTDQNGNTVINETYENGSKIQTTVEIQETSTTITTTTKIVGPVVTKVESETYQGDTKIATEERVTIDNQDESQVSKTTVYDAEGNVTSEETKNSKIEADGSKVTVDKRTEYDADGNVKYSETDNIRIGADGKTTKETDVIDNTGSTANLPDELAQGITVGEEELRENISKIEEGKSEYEYTKEKAIDKENYVKADVTTEVEGNIVADYNTAPKDDPSVSVKKETSEDGSTTTYTKKIADEFSETTIKTVVGTDENGNATIDQNVEKHGVIAEEQAAKLDAKYDVSDDQYDVTKVETEDGRIVYTKVSKDLKNTIVTTVKKDGENIDVISQTITKPKGNGAETSIYEWKTAGYKFDFDDKYGDWKSSDGNRRIYEKVVDDPVTNDKIVKTTEQTSGDNTTTYKQTIEVLDANGMVKHSEVHTRIENSVKDYAIYDNDYVTEDYREKGSEKIYSKVSEDGKTIVETTILQNGVVATQHIFEKDENGNYKETVYKYHRGNNYNADYNHTEFLKEENDTFRLYESSASKIVGENEHTVVTTTRENLNADGKIVSVVQTVVETDQDGNVINETLHQAFHNVAECSTFDNEYFKKDDGSLVDGQVTSGGHLYEKTSNTNNQKVETFVDNDGVVQYQIITKLDTGDVTRYDAMREAKAETEFYNDYDLDQPDEGKTNQYTNIVTTENGTKTITTNVESDILVKQKIIEKNKEGRVISVEEHVNTTTDLKYLRNMHEYGSHDFVVDGNVKTITKVDGNTKITTVLLLDRPLNADSAYSRMFDYLIEKQIIETKCSDGSVSIRQFDLRYNADGDPLVLPKYGFVYSDDTSWGTNYSWDAALHYNYDLRAYENTFEHGESEGYDVSIQSSGSARTAVGSISAKYTLERGDRPVTAMARAAAPATVTTSKKSTMTLSTTYKTIENKKKPTPDPGPSPNPHHDKDKPTPKPVPEIVPTPEIALEVLGAYDEIGNGELPLGVLPKTGDSADPAADMSKAALLALAGVAMTAAGMRRKEEECQ